MGDGGRMESNLNGEDLALHYVCTGAQAREIVAGRDRFWLSACGCREARGNLCTRSRIDVCLQIHAETAASAFSDKKEITPDEVDLLLSEAETKRLVCRPFRGESDRSVTEGICFCCDDCCGYFLNRGERCDKGTLIEQTDTETCNDCGACVDACHFGARSLVDGVLALHREECFGCGLCLQACALACVEMIPREWG